MSTEYVTDFLKDEPYTKIFVPELNSWSNKYKQYKALTYNILGFVYQADEHNIMRNKDGSFMTIDDIARSMKRTKQTAKKHIKNMVDSYGMLILNINKTSVYVVNPFLVSDDRFCDLSICYLFLRCGYKPEYDSIITDEDIDESELKSLLDKTILGLIKEVLNHEEKETKRI